MLKIDYKILIAGLYSLNVLVVLFENTLLLLNEKY